MSKALITQYNSSGIKGGVETFNDYLIRVFPDIMVFDYNSSISYSRLSNIRYIPFFEEPKRALVCAKHFLKLHRKLDFDIVFSNGMFGWYLTLKKINIPMINIFHGNYAGFADHCIEKRNLNYYITKYQNGTFEKVSGKKKRVVSVSKFVKEQIKKYYGLNSTVIHNGIDVEQFKPISKEYAREMLNLPRDSHIGIFVGRPEYAKGFDIILELSELNKQINFLCISDRAIDIRNKNIIIRFQIQNEELYKYYSASDFLIFPSRFEGCSYVPLEAMACNLPVIASKTGLFYEINSPEIGAVISTWNAIDYSNAIKKVLQNPDKFKPRNFIKKNFSFGIFEKRYKNFVNDILE